MTNKPKNKKKLQKKLSKLMKIGKIFIKPRIPIPPPTKTFKSIKDYNRSNNKKIMENEFDD